MGIIAVAIGRADTTAAGNGWYQPLLAVQLFMKLPSNNPCIHSNNLFLFSNSQLLFKQSTSRAALGRRRSILMAPSRELGLVRNKTPSERVGSALT